ncbi:MAG: DUF968 domain-containing protein [Alphaproteobacteria bacterium]|uniref:Uncharacterized protein n=1 Tax=viral metagenome TaxID=1070528 RepID=A0A6H1ZDD7_9ZZZZ|nr:DUF968 domain-containing protein [Alphaproteobacteria bacterium]
MSITAQERIILRKAQEIKRAKNREIRLKIAAARKPGGKANRGRVKDNGFLAFLRRQPCVCGCGRPAPSDPAHIRMASPERGKSSTGMQVKPSDQYAVPLNRLCHERQHSGAEARFWSERGLDPFEIADRLYAEYQGQPNQGPA